MKKCCEKFVFNVDPKIPKDGTFKEKRKCPECKNEITIIFQCSYGLGSDELMCSSIGVD